MKKNSKFKKNKKYMERYIRYAIPLGLLLYQLPVYAADDPLSIINNLSELIFTLTKGVGIILMAFGAIQFGLALKTSDPSQKSNSVLSVIGGAIIYLSKEIINFLLR